MELVKTDAKHIFKMLVPAGLGIQIGEVISGQQQQPIVLKYESNDRANDEDEHSNEKLQRRTLEANADQMK